MYIYFSAFLHLSATKQTINSSPQQLLPALLFFSSSHHPVSLISNMDKLNKLKALTGEDEVLEGATPKGTWSHVKAHNIYEGTDSEDEDEEIPLARRTEPESSNSNDKVSITSSKATIP